MPLNPTVLRAQFPALSLTDEGRPRLYFDNPGGTQVPRQVLDRMQDYLIHTNANHEGPFRTSVASDAVLAAAHAGMADLLNAPSPHEIIFGPNMTTLTLAISRSLATTFRSGDELLLTRMDHDANVAPWLLVAEDLGLTVKWLPFNRQTCRYELDQLDGLLTGRTRLAAVNYASNALGTINDVKAIAERVHAVGGLVYVDAVQYVPHAPTDVQALDCDLLVCSAYKFFGPHQGILWGRTALLESLRAYKVRTASDALPGRFETGTQSHEGQAGTLGVIEYLTWVGQTFASAFEAAFPHLSGRRRTLHAAMAALAAYERDLCAHLLDGLQRIPGLTLYGITDALHERVPTVAFTLAGQHPAEVNRKLAAANIFAWDGHYYALEVVRHLGLEDQGGMVRVGLAHYNTHDEIDRLLHVLRTIS
jgi:cysteine desulfurase family protein (TIGR01976 family)